MVVQCRVGIAEPSDVTGSIRDTVASYYDSAKEAVGDSANSLGQATDEAQGYASKGYEKFKRGAVSGLEVRWSGRTYTFLRLADQTSHFVCGLKSR